MEKLTFEKSKANGIHSRLTKLAGEWEGTTKTWFEPGVVADESPMKGKITAILEGRFLMYEYQGSLQGKAFSGVLILGYDLNTERFQSSWVDSFHMSTGIMFSESHIKNQHDFSVLGSYQAGNEKWGWRTSLELKGKDSLIVTAYNITPGGDEAKATETIYHRKA